MRVATSPMCAASSALTLAALGPRRAEGIADNFVTLDRPQLLPPSSWLTFSGPPTLAVRARHPTCDEPQGSACPRLEVVKPHDPLTWPRLGPNPVAAKLSSMRRVLASLLLALLPLQFSWAAVASYCAFESVADAQHLEHAHAVVDVPSDGDESEPAVESCDHCYCSWAGALLSGKLAHGSLPATRPDAGPDPSIAAPALTPPERPQWASLA